MTEQYGAPGDPKPGEQTTANSSGGPSILACYACKRRKVKCSRELPICSLCQKLNRVCEYPTHPVKPGPKPGSLQRAKRKRLERESLGSIRDASPSAPRQTGSFDPIRNTTVSPIPTSGYRSHDASQSRPVTAPDRAVGPPYPTSPSAAERPGHPTAPIFSRIMYPSHEEQTRPQSPSTVDTPIESRRGAISIDSVCAALKIPRETYDMLMDSYFANMTSFSLFRPGSIELKFALMQHHADAEALIAAMFSFSARHCHDAAVDRASDCPSPSYFFQVASAQLDASGDRYGDVRPPFWLLQAGILVSFYQLSLSVRSRSWRRLGDCIRSSYDLNLHIVDANHEPLGPHSDHKKVDIERWALLEERRRAWWAVWEMDVYASAIRQLPTAIDQSLNLTLLPVPDSCWFNNIYQESCYLVEDCSLRWKHLAQSGNQSAKSWFIVINSLMRNAQRIAYPAGSAIKVLNEMQAKATDEELDVMANCLYCTVSSIPISLSYQGATLDFRNRPSRRDAVNPRQEHADKYSIHLMTQLCRFMIYQHKIRARAPWLTSKASLEQVMEPGPAAQANSEWSNYMSASDEIVLVVRNSSRDHYKHVNPFLVNTLWFAAAAQCACKVFGPPGFNRRLAASNLDLLKLTIDRFISFWNCAENLKGKLARMEVGLKNLMATADGSGAVADAPGPSSRRAENRLSAAQSGAEDDSSGRSPVVLQNPSSDPGQALQQQFPMQGQEPLLLGVGPSGWGDTASSAFVPDLSAFPPPFSLAEQAFFSGDVTDVSPYGLEELLMNSMVNHT